MRGKEAGEINLTGILTQEYNSAIAMKCTYEQTGEIWRFYGHTKGHSGAVFTHNHKKLTSHLKQPMNIQEHMGDNL